MICPCCKLTGPHKAMGAGCIPALRAKLQAAEAAIKSLVDLTKYGEEMQELLSDPLMVASWIKEGIEGAHSLRDETLAENQRLQAEVARLTQQLDDLGHRHAGVESSLHGANARIAELEAIIERTNKHEAHRLEVERRDATEAALWWAWGTNYDTHDCDGMVKRGLKAMLGNNETNTNNQGEINA